MQNKLYIFILCILCYQPLKAQEYKIETTYLGNGLKHVKGIEYEISVPNNWNIEFPESSDLVLIAYDSTYSDIVEAIADWGSFLDVNYLNTDMSNLDFKEFKEKDMTNTLGQPIKLFKYTVNIDGSVFEIKLYIDTQRSAELIPHVKVILESFDVSSWFDE